MPNIDDLKDWLHRDLSRIDKLLIALASLSGPCQIADINRVASEAGLRNTSRWNPSAVLARSNGLAIRTDDGWELTAHGLRRLHEIGLVVRPAAKVAYDLRAELRNVSDPNVRAFADEAIECHEAGLYRSAIVMSWMAAVGVLHHYVHAHHLQKFNDEAKRVNPRWKTAITAEELGNMKEADFLDRLVGISLIGRNVKNELKTCLDRRNSCGHPNSLQIGANTSAHHIEVLLMNVFKKFT